MSDSPLRALQQVLANGGIVVLDGATGTEIERRGAAMHDRTWCATATLTHPEVLRSVHEDYIRAGARVITTNTFSTSRIMLAPAGLGEHFETLNRRAVEIALQAREGAGRPGVLVAGSMSHQVPIHRHSGTRDPRAVPPGKQAEGQFREMADLLAASGVDLLLLEMMSDPALMAPAVAAARATGLPVWVGFSVARDAAGRLRSYALPELPAGEMFRSIDLQGIDAAGVMHSAAEAIGPAIDALREVYAGPLMAYPDSGYFEMPNWRFVDIMPPAELVAFTREWKRSGVQILGGCCGLGLEHIQALSRSVQAL